MKNKIKTKVIGKKLRNYKNIILGWDKYIDDHAAMAELAAMSGREVVKIMRDVWEDIKKLD